MPEWTLRTLPSVGRSWETRIGSRSKENLGNLVEDAIDCRDRRRRPSVQPSTSTILRSGCCSAGAGQHPQQAD
jgi:hypothetical protein